MAMRQRFIAMLFVKSEREKYIRREVKEVERKSQFDKRCFMAVTNDRKYTKAFVHTLLEGIKGKTLGEVDKSHQFDRTKESPKITGIAGDVIEQSVFMSTCTISNQNSIPISLLQKTNHTASLLYGQIDSFQSYKQTNVLPS